MVSASTSQSVTAARSIGGDLEFEAPTGAVGPASSLPGDRIVRDTKGTGTELEIGTTFSPRGASIRWSSAVRMGRRGVSLGELRLLEDPPHAGARNVGRDQRGRRALDFGGNEQTPAAKSAALEFAVRRGNWIGPSVAAGQQPLVTTWNLTCRQTPEGNRVSYRYEQDLDYVGSQSMVASQFTLGCRLKQITGINGESITFNYAAKED